MDLFSAFPVVRQVVAPPMQAARPQPVRRRFAAEIVGRWVAGRLVLEEAFAFDDGATETRSWQFERVGENGFLGTGTDVVGPVQGRQDLGGARMRYRYRLRVNGRPITVALDDRYYRLDAARAINRATLSKFGVRIGELTIVFERQPGSSGVDELAHAAPPQRPRVAA